MEMMEIPVREQGHLCFFLCTKVYNEEALLAILVKRIANETSTSLSLANS